MASLYTLSDETIVLILEYLRAIDISCASLTCKSLFAELNVSLAINSLYSNCYSKFYSIKSPIGSALRPDALMVMEVKSFIAALSVSQPLPGKGYWINATWASDAKRYFEAICLPDLNRPLTKSAKSSKSPAKISPKKVPKAKKRVECPHPDLDMTAGIVCPHGSLFPARSCKVRRKQVESRVWNFLRGYFHRGPSFRASSSECSRCLEAEELKHGQTQEKRGQVLTMKIAVFVPEVLDSLLARKSGVPSLFVNRLNDVEDIGTVAVVAAASTASAAAEFEVENLEPDYEYTVTDTGDLLVSVREPSAPQRNQLGLLQPLVIGLYHVVPRNWLRQWRQYCKDAIGSVSLPPPLDCTSLLCHTHGGLLVPPHLEEYLLGVRRSLLAGLGDYPGEVVEVLSADEWDALQSVVSTMSACTADFNIRFCLDGENISWSADVCRFCDPFNYDHRFGKTDRQRGPNSQGSRQES